MYVANTFGVTLSSRDCQDDQYIVQSVGVAVVNWTIKCSTNLDGQKNLDAPSCFLDEERIYDGFKQTGIFSDRISRNLHSNIA